MIFNGEAKTITLISATLDVVVLWSSYLNWLATDDNAKFEIGLKAVGGDDISVSSGTKIPPYVYLINGWKIKPMESNHTLNVGNGILLVDGGGDPFLDADGAYTIRINYAQPVQAITVATGGGGGGATASDIWAAPLSSNNTADTFGELMQKMLTVAKFIGLK